jgi:CheY-like chemotaxis protein
MTPRLLVIDDDETQLLLYRLILEREGYDVHLIASGFPQAMNLDVVLPDLMIVDYHVGRHGRNEPLWQQLKAFPPTAAIPLILCTADAHALCAQEDLLRDAGVRVVLKPFTIDALLQTIRQALQGTRACKTA